MKDLLSFIPGFRSNTKWKKIIAIIYYVISVLMMFTELFTALSAIILPFFIFDLIDLIKHKKKAIPLKYAVVRFASALLVLCLALNMAGLSSGNSSSTSGSGAVNQAGEKDTDKDVNTDDKDTEDTNSSDKDIIDNKSDTGNKPNDQGSTGSNPDNDGEDPGSKDNNVSGKVVVHFIDVGQGDSVLIQAPSFNMLIDGGNRGNTTVNYIKNKGVKELDIVIGTHPHADHIGGLVNVLEEIKVKEVIDPAVVHTSKTFEDYLTLIDEKNIKFTEAKTGMKRDLGNGASLEFMGPLSASDSNLNNVSVVTRLVFGDISFLFTGDSETSILNQLAKGNIKSDVLKVAHHGSENGMSQKFISAVNPRIAVISAGKDNSYGHPHSETLDILAANDVDIYRTDLNGTIVIETDGQVIDVNVKQPYQHIPPKVPDAADKPAGSSDDKPEPAPAPTKIPELTEKPSSNPVVQPTQKPDESSNKGKYVGSTESDKYHDPDCRYAKKILSVNEVWFDTVGEAQQARYSACGVCKPK